MSGKGTLGRKSIICRDGHSFTQAHYTVLNNSSLAAPYIKKHMDILCSSNPGKPESLIRQQHKNTFGSWLQTHVNNDKTIGDQMYLLPKSPSSTIWTYQGYEINENTFYTIVQDKKSTNQNSGVLFDAENDDGSKDTYYGYIEEIGDLDYAPTFKVPLFRCKWVKMTAEVYK
jgi:hypothetical protein